MKKFISLLLALLGINSACGTQPFEDADVAAFDQLIKQDGVQLLDVRTPKEFAEGHLPGAINVDVKADDFVANAKARLDSQKTVAVYCRSGKRSVQAAKMLAKEGFKVVNLLGGIQAWQKAERPVTTTCYETDSFSTPGGKTVTFHALMHGSIRIVYDGTEIEIDPVNKLGERTIDFTQMPKAHFILVTHEHADHFDRDAIATLSGDATRLITNKRCASMLGHGDVMSNGDSIALRDDITLKAVPAYNTTEGREKFHPKGRDNGFILTIDGLRVYIAGDTEDIPEMKDINDIDVAFMPCNQPYTMTVDQLVNAARMVKPKVLFPYHYGQTDVKGVPEMLKNDGIDVRIRHYE